MQSGRAAFAREEESERLLDAAMEAVGELVLYASPLLDQWEAPPHPLLSEAREAKKEGSAGKPWMRRGPRALSRAWCNLELGEAVRATHNIGAGTASDRTDTQPCKLSAVVCPSGAPRPPAADRAEPVRPTHAADDAAHRGARPAT